MLPGHAVGQRGRHRQDLVLHAACAQGRFTWRASLNMAALRDRSTWPLYMATLHGHSSWPLYMATLHGHFTWPRGKEEKLEAGGAACPLSAHMGAASLVRRRRPGVPWPFLS